MQVVIDNANKRIIKIFEGKKFLYDFDLDLLFARDTIVVKLLCNDYLTIILYNDNNVYEDYSGEYNLIPGYYLDISLSDTGPYALTTYREESLISVPGSVLYYLPTHMARFYNGYIYGINFENKIKKWNYYGNYIEDVATLQGDIQKFDIVEGGIVYLDFKGNLRFTKNSFHGINVSDFHVRKGTFLYAKENKILSLSQSYQQEKEIVEFDFNEDIIVTMSQDGELNIMERK